MKIFSTLFLFISLLIIYSFCFCGDSFAQEQRPYGAFSGSTTKSTEKKILKSARKEFDYGNYAEANQKYLELLKLDSLNPMYNFEQAQTLYNDFHQPASIPYYERAIKYSKDTLGEAYYFLASAYHLASKFEAAQKNYKIYLAMLENYGTELMKEEETDLISDILHRMEMCSNGNKLSQSPTDVFFFNGRNRPFEISSAGKDVNSEYDDYGAVLSANDSVMYFTSRREGTTGGKFDWDDKFFEDIYASGLGKNGWGNSFSIGEPINTDKHEAIINIAADGKTIYFYKGVKQGTFYYTNIVGNTWTNPEVLYEKSDMNTKAWESSFFGFTLAGSELYVVSDRESGLSGGRNIFLSQKQPDGTWGPMKDIGAPINTPYDEDAPFITADGKTMYFSSTGHNSIGGFDIFKSERQGDKWSEPVNLGIPFNTPGDDIYFIIANKTDRAYYSSSAQATDGTRDMDVYMIDICEDAPERTINGLAIGFTSGTITASEKESGKQAGTFDVKDSRFFMRLAQGKNYILTVNTIGIKTASVEVYVPRKCRAFDMYQEIVLTQPGQPLVFKNAFFDIKSEAGAQNFSEFLSKADKTTLANYTEVSANTVAAMVAIKDTVKVISKDTVKVTTISFSNILFEYDKAAINNEFKSELDKVAAYLKDADTKKKIEVGGYTDSKGSDEYNLALSKRRASAIVSYLATKGVKKNRMKAVGYGETKSIAPNENSDGSDNPDGRAKNRRTEIVIIQ